MLETNLKNSTSLSSVPLFIYTVQISKTNNSLLKPTQFDETNKKYFELTQLITGLYLLPFISLFGITGSLFNIFVYKNCKKYSTNVYLIALSTSDILKLLNDFLYFLVNLVTKLDPGLGNKIFNHLYLYSHYVFVLTAINTSWLTCTIAFDRYIILLDKNGKQRQQEYFTSILISILIALVSSIIAIPSPLFIRSINELDPSTNQTIAKVADSNLNSTNFKIVYSYFTAMFRAFIPLVIIIYLNYNIIRIVYKNKMKRKSIKSNKKAKSKYKITLMLIIIVLTFTICMFPDAIMTMMQLGYANESYLVRSIREITDLLLAINSSTTFPICYYFSLQYRDKFKELFLFYKLRVTKSETDFDENTSYVFTKARILINDKSGSNLIKNSLNQKSNV